MELHEFTLKQQLDGLRKSTFSSVELTQNYLKRIKSKDPSINSYITVTEELALKQAGEADDRYSKGKALTLDGIPIAHKDIFCTEDVLTTCGSKMLSNFKAPYSSTVVSKLFDQGVVMLGKTNMDEFAMGLTTEFSAYGPSKNPWNTEYVPGGSSGGSAVSVSAFECVASLGSDTGGSVRNPASFCSAVGYKPTYGLISRYGLISYANSIEQIGPLTRTVKDSAFMLNLIAGIDTNDNTTVNNNNEDYLANIDSGIEGKRIGIITEMIGDGIDPEVLTATKEAISKLEGLGAICE